MSRELSIVTSKVFESMKKQAHIPTPKYVPTGQERRDEVKLLAKEHVRHVAPTILANIKTNRDVGGIKNKFDGADSRREIRKDQIKTPDFKPEKWVDENDEDTTWLVIPVSRKFINTGSSMIPVIDILNKSIKHPEFTFVEAIMGAHTKTGKEVIKAYKIKYEKMSDEQAISRANSMFKKQKEEAKQARKEEAARRRST